ncbi:ribosomal-protein-serine acetyltransferase [Weizmannia acidilactici]|uniref:Ribosomal-protein-serine acetyltransferase n=1 Tax=Weizmannia acidilactici TaxID=2607726 RepID=A0A5J4JC94_9BACI|nr:GNAT family protein [Weizmannia acidilactici]GER66564.1 ribosomal-protein-serine acetyltransferase [Weizmannia acidilactici]GER68839.1 ribosomal-protein-serine acetyltransferase [Weizmannia acidilactici]GER74584.1 ribosomal-protein-serine acetyltransferase [Weizmannia acidilactici]
MFGYQIDGEVSLKLPELRDAETVFKLTDQSRQYLRKWLPWLDGTTSVEDTKNFIRAPLKDYAENKGMTAFVLFNGEICGTVSYNSIDWTNRAVHIGYWFGEPYQGHGIMTKVVKAMTDYAFKQLNMNRVEIRAATNNSKSRAILERLGFKEEGIIRQSEWLYDHFVDHVVYGMLASEWKTGKKPDIR